METVNKYQPKAIRKNSFATALISLDDIIGVESIESMYDFTLECGDHIWGSSESDIYEYEDVKNYIIKNESLTKKEIEDADWDGIVKRILSDSYRNNYESELYNEYFNHIEDKLSHLQYHFEGPKSYDAVHFSEATHIRIAITKKEYLSQFENDLQYYNTKEEFFDNAEECLQDNVSSIEKYDAEHFDYYGCRIDCAGWKEFADDCYEVYEVTQNRKHHQSKLKSWIKNKIPLCYRTAC